MSRRSLQSLVLAAPLIGLLAGPLPAQEKVDLDALNRLREEGLHRSQVMATVAHLTDVIGPRLTASPAAKMAAEWTRDQMQGWGLANSHLEAFDYGEGWSYNKSNFRVLAPHTLSLLAIPKAWTPGTGGVVRGEAVQVTLEDDEDFAAQKGKLAGKIVLLSGPREVDEDAPEETAEAPFARYTSEELAATGQLPIPAERRDGPSRWIKRWTALQKVNAFLVEEGVVAAVDMSRRDNGVIGVQGGGSYGYPGRGRGVPSVVIAAEPYQRLLRLLDAGTKVELELEVETSFHTDDTHGYNVVAEIPGSDKKGEVVMLGAHLDSWHAGTGATDNAAGCAVVMEAARILKAAGLTPRRTIRVALWTGEEQGLIGSEAYVRDHFASRPETTDPEQLELPAPLRKATWPLTPKPEHAKLSAYFNLDNGSGRIRGIYAQENVAAAPIFRAWLEPLRDLGADTVTTQNTGSTDHEAFDDAGLPGFQFIQDELDYESRTHHSNLDTFEHLRRDDLIQASVVLASFVYNAAQRDQLLPRKPLPQEPPKKPASKEKAADKGKGEAAAEPAAPAVADAPAATAAPAKPPV